VKRLRTVRLYPYRRAEGAEFRLHPLCQLAPAYQMVGASSIPGLSMNDNHGALAVIIIDQWLTILLLALILWRIW
jgi:hypothetical protein